jgi:hypothetical protein
MNEKPGLEPGFFCSTSCWRLDGLRVVPRTCLSCHFGVGLARAWKRANVIQSPKSAVRNDPTGKSLISCPAPWQKIFWFSEDANQLYILAVPSQTEGRLAIVTNAGRDAVDADALLTNGA